MKFPSLVLCLLAFIIFATAKVNALNAGSVFTVTSVGDSVDFVPGDGACLDAVGKCTLRAAIQEANSTPMSRDFIIFSLPNQSVIDLTLGELLISGNTVILGPGSRQLTVERSSAPGTPNFRIFRTAPPFNVPIDIRRIKISNGNAGAEMGGGIFIQGKVNLAEVTFTSNSAFWGGAIANFGSFSMTRSLVNSNTATMNGGAIANLDGTFGVVTISDSTITNNLASVGGAIYEDENSAPFQIINSTIVRNSASVDAQSIFTATGSFVQLLNTIVGSNNPSTVDSLSGTFSSSGHNIVTDARGSTGFVNGVNGDQVSINNAIDPLLAGLADNGGQTDTYSLLPGSPAIDAGNNCVFTNSGCFPGLHLRFDQRTGHSRFLGAAVDVGAVEFGVSNVVTTGSFGIFPTSHQTFYSGSVEVLIDPTTNNRIYKTLSFSGQAVFRNVTGDLFIIEFRVKRKLAAFGPFLVTPGESTVFSLVNESPIGVRLIGSGQYSDYTIE